MKITETEKDRSAAEYSPEHELSAVEITDISTAGEGIGRIGGAVVFIPHTVPGDTAEVEITEKKKNFLRGRMVRLLSPSPDRTAAPCPYFGRCGGCTLQNLTYEAQLRLKEKQITDKLARIYGGEFPQPEPIIGMDDPWHYRNKGTYTVYAGPAILQKDGSVRNAERPRVGFFDGRERHIVECESCLIQSRAAEKAAEALREYIRATGISVYDEKRKKGRLHQMTVRTGFRSREVMVVLSVSGKKIPKPDLLTDLMIRAVDSLNDEIEARLSAIAEEQGLDSYADVETEENWYELKSLVIDHSLSSSGGKKGSHGSRPSAHGGKSKGQGGGRGETEVIFGSPVIADESAGLIFEISPRSFYQVNSLQMEKLYATVLEFADLKGGETVFDLYCGVGTIGLYCAQKAGYVWGIEAEKSAVADANRNAVLNGIVNIQFLCGKAEEEIVPLITRLREERRQTADRNMTADQNVTADRDPDAAADVAIEAAEAVSMRDIPEQVKPAGSAELLRDADGSGTEGYGQRADLAGTGRTADADGSDAAGKTADLVIVDPPRAGCRPELLEAILDAAPEKIIYVSCDPGTLARDLAYLTADKYEIRRIRPVDQFCHSVHVETVVLLSHKKPDSTISVKVEFGEGEGKVPLDNIAKRAEAYKPKERVTYKMIKEYIEAKYGFKVHAAYIAEVKRSLGLPMYDAPNAVEELKQPRKHPTAEKVEAIKDALKHFEVI